MAKKKSKKKHKKANKSTTKVTQATQPKKKSSVKKSAPKKKGPEAAPVKSAVSSEKTSKSKGVFLIIALVIIVLVGIMLFFYGQAQLVRDEAANTGQDDLLKVQPAAGDSLQPTNGTDTNPQQSAPSPQGSSGDGQTLQPNSSSQETQTPTQ